MSLWLEDQFASFGSREDVLWGIIAGSSTRIARASPSRRPNSQKSFMHKTGECLETIEPAELSSVTEPDGKAILTDYEFLASYNWVDTKAQPSMSQVNSCFPASRTVSRIDKLLGAPPVWNSKELPFRILKDTGTCFVDQNTARFTKYPFEPLFRSLAVMQPNFDMKDVDVVTDRNSLRKLLHFASDTVRDPFRINVKLVGGVLFFSRWEPETKFLISGFQNTGFGHNFEKVTTSLDSGLKIVVGTTVSSATISGEFDAWFDTRQTRAVRVPKDQSVGQITRKLIRAMDCSMRLRPWQLLSRALV